MKTKKYNLVIYKHIMEFLTEVVQVNRKEVDHYYDCVKAVGFKLFKLHTKEKMGL